MPLSLAVRRHKLGTQLRRLRQVRGLRLEEVAVVLGVAPSTLSRIETGQAPTRTSYLALMLDLYRIYDPEARKILTDMAREGQRKEWWEQHDDVLPPGIGSYLRLEATASEVCSYSPQVVPDLVQTAEYAAAVIRASRPDLGAEQVRKLVTLQGTRQEVLHRRGLRLRLIIDESALRRPVGPGDVVTEQLEHLLALSACRTVTVQVTAQAAISPVLSSSFALLSFTDPADPAIACCHGPGGQVLTTRRSTDIGIMRATFKALSGTALSTTDTEHLISLLIHG
jgi:transcriptional regulator with XRE-family HTH domain